MEYSLQNLDLNSQKAINFLCIFYVVYYMCWPDDDLKVRNMSPSQTLTKRCRLFSYLTITVPFS